MANPGGHRDRAPGGSTWRRPSSNHRSCGSRSSVMMHHRGAGWSWCGAIVVRVGPSVGDVAIHTAPDLPVCRARNTALTRPRARLRRPGGPSLRLGSPSPRPDPGSRHPAASPEGQLDEPGGPTRRAGRANSTRRSETRRRLGSPAGFEEECRQVRRSWRRGRGRVGPFGPQNGTKVPARLVRRCHRARERCARTVARGSDVGRRRRTAGRRPTTRRPWQAGSTPRVRASRSGPQALGGFTSCGRPMRGRSPHPPQPVASSYVASSVSASASAPARVRPPFVVT